MSLFARLGHCDLKEACFADKRVSAVAWSGALEQSADQRLEQSIVLAIVHVRQRTPQRLHDDQL